MTAAPGHATWRSGPGNTIWFTEETGNRVGRVTGIELPEAAAVVAAVADTTEPKLTKLRLSAKRFRLGSKLPSASPSRTGTQRSATRSPRPPP